MLIQAVYVKKAGYAMLFLWTSRVCIVLKVKIFLLYASLGL